jgi:hypothetical protein
MISLKLALILLLDAPRYSRGLIIAASCAIAATGVILISKLLYRLFDNGDDGVEVDYGIAA